MAPCCQPCEERTTPDWASQLHTMAYTHWLQVVASYRDAAKVVRASGLLQGPHLETQQGRELWHFSL